MGQGSTLETVNDLTETGRCSGRKLEDLKRAVDIGEESVGRRPPAQSRESKRVREAGILLKQGSGQKKLLS